MKYYVFDAETNQLINALSGKEPEALLKEREIVRKEYDTAADGLGNEFNILNIFVKKTNKKAAAILADSDSGTKQKNIER